MSSWLARLRGALGGRAEDPTVAHEPVDCDEVMRVLQSYLDGELRIGAAEVSAHLEACRHCDVEAATYERIKAALARPSEDGESGIGGEAAADPAVARLRSFAADLASGVEGGA